MGYFFRANNLNWSLFIVIVYSGYFIVNCNNLLGDFGINTFPDKTQINISLQEYTTVISGFLKRKNKSLQIIPELKLHVAEDNTAIKKKVNNNTNQNYVKMIFPVKASATEVIESARLHLLLPAQKRVLNQTVTIQVNQILGVRRKHFLDKETFYLNETLRKWCDIDITSAVLSWIKGHRRNLGLEIICLNCTNNNINPHLAAITAVVRNNNNNNNNHFFKNNNHNREKRSEKLGRTDCSARHLTEKGKKRCCRHDMIVNFNDIKFMRKVFVPNFYEAGYCHGMCPPDYNFATNHSRIQGYLHQRYRKSSKKSSSSIPKTCCAPSKFGDLEIVIPDKTDPTKLQIEKWDNMIVLECACS